MKALGYTSKIGFFSFVSGKEGWVSLKSSLTETQFSLTFVLFGNLTFLIYINFQ